MFTQGSGPSSPPLDLVGTALTRRASLNVERPISDLIELHIERTRQHSRQQSIADCDDKQFLVYLCPAKVSLFNQELLGG